MKLYSIDDFRIDNFSLDRYRIDNYRLGGAGGGTIIDHSTPVTVINAAYDTSGNGGRKLIRLNSGNLYAAMRNGTTAWYIYKSTDNGDTWSQFKTVTVSVNDIALATNGTNIYAIISYSTSGVKCYAYNESGTVLVNGVNVDASQSTMGLCSLAIDSSGNIHAAWASKNATYPNSFNIRYSKSTDGGATWATPTQITTSNASNVNANTPTIVCGHDNNPIIVFQYITAAPTYSIRYKRYSGTGWVGIAEYGNTLYNGASYIQSNPCAVVSPDGTIHVVWHGFDSVNTTYFNIRYSKSTDNGATWSSMLNLTNQNAQHQMNPTIASDKNNNIHVIWRGGVTSSISEIRKTVYTGTWGNIVNLTSGSVNNQNQPSACENYKDFTDPLIIYVDSVTPAIKFRGVFTA